MGPQHCGDEKHPDTMIKDFRALLKNPQDATHRVAIYSGMWEFIKHNSRNRTYISDEQLHAMELYISMVLMFKSRVKMVNAYLRFVDAQEARAGAKGID